MKKILFSCLVALGVGVSAQYDLTQDFETDLAGWSQFGGGAISTSVYCSAVQSGALALGSTGSSGVVSQTGWMAKLDEFGQDGNGQKINVSFNYRKDAALTGTLYVMYAKLDEATNLWDLVTVGPGVTVTAGAITTCASYSMAVPAGAIQEGSGTYGVGAWFIRSGSTVGNFYVDDIVVKQDVVTTVPSCTSFTAPAAGSTVPAGNYSFAWTIAPTASKYKITIGSASGGSDVLNTTVAGNVDKLFVNLQPGKTYFAKIVPTNDNGDAVGCSEISFSTNNQIGHCGPLTSNQAAAIAPIKSVNFAGVTNTSDPTATTIGTFPVHQDFTTTEFPVTSNMTSVPLTINGTTNGNPSNGWAMSVFVDWNNDGDFDDAGESYFNTTATMKRKAGVADNPIVLTGNITIPAGTPYGKKTMRVKYNFSGTTIHPALVSGCAEMGNGQAEDYTIDYKEFMAVSDINKANISLYPNPFKDVLKISDVKGATSVVVTDISGRTVKTLAPSAELQLSDLKKGVYIVTIKFENGTTSTSKVIKD